jgi:hypothetical protein
LASALAVLLLGGALVGCTPNQAGSAAIVGENSLSENTLTKLAQEVQGVATRGQLQVPQADALNQRVVAVWVDEQLTAELARTLKVTATQADVDNLLGQFAPDQLAQIQVSSGIASSMLQDAARAAVLRQGIARALAPSGATDAQNAALTKAYRDAAARLGVSVNPRFGFWNSGTGQVDAPNDALSRLAQTPAAPGGVPVLPNQG